MRIILILACLLFSFFGRAQCVDLTTQFTVSQTAFCGSGTHTLNLTNTSTGSHNGIASYDWYLNGTLVESTTGLTSPSPFSLGAFGNYTVLLVGTDTSSCSDSATVLVSVVPTPIASFTFNPNNGCAELPVSFTNTSTNTVTGTIYTWNFGDGASSNAQNPTHTFASGGTFNVVLTVQNAAGCTDTYSQTVSTQTVPICSGILGDDGDGNTSNCLLPGDPTTSETVNFSSNTSGAISYLWDFGDGNTSTSNNPSNTYTAYGTYTVTMIATGPNGCTITRTMTVVFERFVSASLSLNVTEYSGCTPLILNTLTNNSVNANTYSWNFGDGTPTYTTNDPTPPTHSYTQAGNFTITLTASNSCNTAFATIGPIIVVGKPKTNFSFSGYTGCAPASLNFTNSTTGTSPANAYTWNMGNGNTYTTTVTPPTQNYDTTGTYTISLTASNACGDSTLTRTITLDTVPKAQIDVLPTNEGCSPMSFAINNNSTGNITYYRWYVDGVLYSTNPTIGNLNYSYPPGNTPVTHTVSLTVGNGCGASSDALTLIIHRPTQADFTISDTAVCLGSAINFTDNSLGESLTYDWNFGDGTTVSTVGPHSITYASPGTYTVQLIAHGYCGNDTVVKSVHVYPYPIADFSPDVSNGCVPLSVTFTNNSTIGASQAWNFGTGASPASSSAYSPGTVTYSTVGTAQIILTVSENGCTSADTNTLSIYGLPNVAFTVTPNTGCSILDVQLNNTSTTTGTESYAWDLGNGLGFNGYTPPNQQYTANTSDSLYHIKLIVSNGNSCSDSMVQTLLVHPLPNANFDFISDTICQNINAGFVNNSTAGMTYAWNFGDGTTASGFSPTHLYLDSGTYTVQLIVQSPYSCSDTLTKNIVVFPIPTANYTATTVCFGYATNFTDQSLGTITDWNWDFGDGTTSNTQNPTHTYSSTGNFNVSLHVTNDYLCSSDYTSIVAVNAVPIADFSVSDTCFGSPTAFSNQTMGATVGYTWNFGDGSPADNLLNPTHVFPSVGNYSVELVAFGGSGCSDTIVKTVSIQPVPTANFTFITACTGDTSYFNSTSTGSPDDYFWDFGNGTVDNTNNTAPKVVYTTSGVYNVSLTATYNSTGCSNTIVQVVDAHPRTVPQFSATTVCLDGATQFTDGTTNTPIKWNWNFGDASAPDTLQNPSHVYADSGTYTVQLITQNIYGCPDTVENTVTVHPLPIANFGFDTVCLNAATLFSDSSLGAVAWSYDFGDVSNSTLASPSHTYSASGSYVVQQIVSNVFGCLDTAQQAVIVSPNPIAQFTADTACYSYLTTFSNQSSGTLSYAWDFADSNSTSNQTSPTHVYSGDGIFTPTLIATNVYGCTDTVSNPVLVLPQPIAGFINTTVCAKDILTFTDTSYGSPTSFTWDFGDGSGTYTGASVTHSYPIGGFYTIAYTVKNNAGCADTITKTIQVYTVPVPNFTADTVCLNNITHFSDSTVDSTPLSSWNWNFGDGNTSSNQNPNYIYQSSGIFNVTLTTTNNAGCDSSITKPVQVNIVPVADFSFTIGCFGVPTVFTDQSTNNPGIYLWDFGDGTTLNGGPNEQHLYATPGSYVVTLQVFGSDSICGDSKTEIVTISGGAQADFVIPPQVCVNEVFNFYDNSTTTSGTISGYQWDMGDSTTYTTANGTHAYSAPGSYQITLVITTSGGCQATQTHTIGVLPATTANYTWADTCALSSTQFTNISNGNTTNWFWDFGDGTTSQTQFPTHVYTNGGSYSVMLVVQNLSGCADTITQTVTINPTPVIDFSSNVVCFGTPTQFTNLSTISTGAISNYEWNFGNNEGSSSLTDPAYTFTSYTQTHDVTLIAVSDKGCTDTLVKPVSLLPIVDFNIDMGNHFGCAPVTVYFDNQSTISGAAVLNYTWDFADGDSSFVPSPTHTFLNPGTYPVVVTVYTSTDCKITQSDSLQIDVFPTPIAGFAVQPESVSISHPYVEIVDDSQGATQWEYDLGDGNYSNASSLSHVYGDVGNYFITQYVKNDQGCMDSTRRYVIVQDDFTLYIPNSFTPGDANGINDYFTWVVSGYKTFEINLFNRWGELIFQSKDPSGKWDGTYQGEKAEDGVYVWKVHVIDVSDKEHTMTGHVTLLR